MFLGVDMNKILWMLPLSLCLVMCKSNEKRSKQEAITPRDFSVTKDNAYNDLFLDSMDVVKFLEESNLPEDTARRITSFYNARNYEFAWFASDGLSEQAMGFTSLLNLSKDTSAEVKRVQAKINRFLGQMNPSIKKTKEIIDDEIFLTRNLIEYIDGRYEKGVIKQKELEHFVPYKKMDALYVADSLLSKKNKDDAAYMMVNEPFKLLVTELVRYNKLAKGEEWRAIKTGATYKKGASDPELLNIKTNLFLTGDMELDTSAVYNDDLEAGIRHLQKRIGQEPDGKINREVLAVLNTPPAEMVKKILLNLNRMRWLPQELPGNLLKVNIPEYKLYVEHDGKEVKNMPVVVGKEGHATVLFSDKMTTIVFSPYWNVPPSIVKSEILPAMESDNTYLDRNDMEITGDEGGLPVIRQRPGAKNSLGKVKFLFPNSFNIYFHDTPAKSLFSQDKRASSHGCIRLGEPEWLANWLLRDDSNWDESKIRAAMNKGTESHVKLKTPVAVTITYYTAWVDDHGLNLRTDLYGHDEQVLKKMFK